MSPRTFWRGDPARLQREHSRSITGVVRNPPPGRMKWRRTTSSHVSGVRKVTPRLTLPPVMLEAPAAASPSSSSRGCWGVIAHQTVQLSDDEAEQLRKDRPDLQQLMGFCNPKTG